MSKTPITASSEAAAVTGMPWSCAAGTKWVFTRPFVEAPQIAKVPASSQNGTGARRAETSARTRAPGGTPQRGGLRATNSVAPYGGRPTSAGWSRSSSQTNGTTASAAQRDRHGGRAASRAVVDDPGQQRQEDQLAGGARPRSGCR